MGDPSAKTGHHLVDNQPANAGFQFRLLGPLLVTYKGESLAALPFRTYNLLAALLLNPHPQPRHRLIGLLFPDLPERNGRRRLSDLLWLLRRALPHLPLQADNQEVYLPSDQRWLDVEAFQLAASSKELPDWLAAIVLYRGPLLEEAYDDWLLVEREGLYLLHVNLLHRICETYLQQREYDAVLPYAERLVQAEPYDERALRALMQAYRAVGKRGAALAAFDRFVALVAHDLSIEPEPATRALAAAIRSGIGQTRLVEPTPVAVNDHVALLQLAHTALARCDRTAVAACLEQLRRNPDTPPEAICLLEVDLALLYEEYDRAAVQLQRCSADGVPQRVRAAQLLLAQRGTARARDVAAEALMLAHQAGNQADELKALLVLAQAQQQFGQNM